MGTILKNGSYHSLVNDIIQKNRKVIIYGAGMIGQVIIPYLMREYYLFDFVECFVDRDKRKAGKIVRIDQYIYRIEELDYLCQKRMNILLLVTNSKFFPIIQFLDQIEELNETEVYLIPLMQIYEFQMVKSIEIKKMSSVQMIPKKIHYCWFGEKPISEFMQKCIQSWRINCPDYEIICWNEHNYDINKYLYTKEAYRQKKYGFVSDLARLDILYCYGGIYFDTDVTLIKNIDELLYQKAFVGIEKWGNINTGGGCGFIAGHPALKEMIRYRNKFSFLMEDGSFHIETNGVYETIPFLESGFKPNNSMQIINNVTIYPFYVFHPYDYISCEILQKEYTYSIHHFCGGWMEKQEQLDRENTQKKYISLLERIKLGGYPINNRNI